MDKIRRNHFLFLGFFIFLLFFLLILQFYRIQILEGKRWKKEAQAQHHHVLIEPFLRGRFFSNSSIKEGHPYLLQPLVVDIPKFHLYIDPEAIPVEHKSVMVEKLLYFVPEAQKKKEKILSEFFLDSRSRKIFTWLDRSLREEIERWWLLFSKKEKIPRNALYFVQEYRRSYPFGSLLGQVLHTLREEKDPKTLRDIPTGGLEWILDRYLRGKPGKRVILRSPRHPLDVGVLVEKSEDGADVFLSINHCLQAIVEEELEKGVKKAEARGGWAVMLDPFSGEVLALAQYPFFDLSQYARYFKSPEQEQHTRVKAVCDSFEPGSIFKPLVVALCLKANEELKTQGKKLLFSPFEKIDTSNGKMPGRKKPLKDVRKHSYLNMYLGIQKSSNVYMGKLVQRLLEKKGSEWFRKGLSDVFQLGKKTDIELPGESRGNLPTPGKLHPNGKLEWSLSTPYSLAIGHNILISSLQLARAYAIFANGGYCIYPMLVKKIVKKTETGEEILLGPTDLARKKKERVLSEAVCNQIITALKFVTKPGGTSPLADVPGYTEAGKSGTSEKIINGKYSEKQYLSSFVGFAPVKKARFVVMVTLDEPRMKYLPGFGKNHHGGVCAAPIFREIARRSLEYLGTAPDNPCSDPESEHFDPKKADWIEETKRLRELYKEWNL